MTVCAGVPVDQITTSRLEKLLGEASPQCDVEVYNLCCGGYDIMHYVATLKEVGLTYRPDLILVFLFPGNDFDFSHYEDDRRYIETNAGRGNPLPVPPVESKFYKKLYTYQVLVPRVRGLIDQSAWINRRDQVLMMPEQNPNAWQNNIDGLRQLVALARDANVPCAAFILTDNWRSYADQRRTNDFVLKTCEDAGLPAYSLCNAFEATGESSSYFCVNLLDLHPDAEYCRVASEAIFDLLRQKGWFDRLIAMPQNPPVGE